MFAEQVNKSLKRFFACKYSARVVRFAAAFSLIDRSVFFYQLSTVIVRAIAEKKGGVRYGIGKNKQLFCFADKRFSDMHNIGRIQITVAKDKKRGAGGIIL